MMSEPETQNPFASPASVESIYTDPTREYERINLDDLPSRWLRLGAFLLDSLFLLVGMVPMIVALSAIAMSLEFEQDSILAEILFRLIALAIVTLVYSGINFIPLARSGQT